MNCPTCGQEMVVKFDHLDYLCSHCGMIIQHKFPDPCETCQDHDCEHCYWYEAAQNWYH